MAAFMGTSAYVLSLSEQAVVWGRLLFAFAAGAVIGVNRGIKRRGAGIKTHVLVCMSAALVMMTGEYIFHSFGTGDVARLGAQVISGVGFLGVGTIMVTGRNQIKGLTTAATLWTSACIGLAAGIGFMGGAAALLVLVMLDLIVMNRIDRFIMSRSPILELYIEFGNIRAMSALVSVMRENKVNFQFSQINKSKVKSGCAVAVATVRMDSHAQYDQVVELVRNTAGVNFVEKM